ncbi:MAG: hypothetical protein IKK38_01235 [Spirochaetaceae bacterium]|nr:hypothetical protein [Spirochaetaceae bacterium]
MEKIRAKIENQIEMIKTLFNSYKVSLALAFLHFWVTTVFQLDKCFFVYDSDTQYYYFIKLLYFFTLCFLYCFVFYVYKQCRLGNKKVKRWFYIFSLYSFIMLCFLLILWPGTWSWDDILVLDTIRLYKIYAWQHIFTCIYQTVLLNIIPCAGGIILIQNLIISAFVAYSIVEIESYFFKKQIIHIQLLDSLVKLLPFLLPGVLSYQFSGYRYGLYVYCVLALFVLFICANHCTFVWKFWKFLLCIILSVIVAEWRTESMFFVLVSILLLIMQKKQKCSLKLKIFGILFIVLSFFVADSMQKKLLGNSDYEILSTLCPLVQVVRNADENDEELIKELECVINVQQIYDSNGNGEAMFLGGKTVKPNYSKEDYKRYLKAFFILSLRHPMIAAKERIRMFVLTSAFMGKTHVTHHLIINSTKNIADFDISESSIIARFGTASHNKPIFNKLRQRLIDFWTNNKTYRIIWNPVIPMFFLFAAWIYCLVKQKWYFFILLCGEAARVVLVFLTAPAPWFMYYLPEYLLGWSLVCYTILYSIGLGFWKKNHFRFDATDI